MREGKEEKVGKGKSNWSKGEEAIGVIEKLAKGLKGSAPEHKAEPHEELRGQKGAGDGHGERNGGVHEHRPTEEQQPLQKAEAASAMPPPVATSVPPHPAPTMAPVVAPVLTPLPPLGMTEILQINAPQHTPTVGEIDDSAAPAAAEDRSQQLQTLQAAQAAQAQAMQALQAAQMAQAAQAALAPNLALARGLLGGCGYAGMALSPAMPNPLAALQLGASPYVAAPAPFPAMWPPMATPVIQPGFAPIMPFAPMPAQPTLQDQLKRQIEHYFSEDNLRRDFYLRREMSLEGFVPLIVIGSFPRVQQLVPTIDGGPSVLQLLCDAISQSDQLELDPSGTKVRRRKGWEKYLLPAGGAPPP